MEIEEALTTYLLAQPGLTALIARRFYFDLLPDDCNLPAVVCLNISDVKEHTLTEQDEWEHPNFQFTAYSATKLGAKLVAAQLKAALSDYSGTLSGITVQYIQLINELSTVETSADGMIKVYTTDLEYEINIDKE